MRLQCLRSASSLLVRCCQGRGKPPALSSRVILAQQGCRVLSTTSRCTFSKCQQDRSPAKIKLDGHTFSHGRQVAAAAYNDQQGVLEVGWADGGTTHYPYLWLRDNCTCKGCFCDASLSRSFLMADLDVNNKPADVQVDAGSVKITWSDGHVSQYSSDWLEGRSFTPEVQEERSKWMLPRKIRHWGSELLGSIPTFTFEQLMSDDRSLYDWISSLEEIGLALVKAAPCKEGQLKRIGDRVAFLRRTNYGETFTVKAKLDPSNLAYTPSTLGVHTDLSYYAYTPGMQMLHCIKQVPTKGGENQLGDGFRAAMILKEHHPELYDVLVSTPVDYMDIGTDYYKFFKLNRQPVIGLNRDGEVNKITLNHQVRDSFLHAPLEVVNKLYVALKTLNDIFYEPENHVLLKMEDGDIVCFHNYRVLHGRTGYTMLEGGERHLEGAYIDWDELNSRRRVLLTELRLFE